MATSLSKVALITGGGSGIGLETARHLRKKGWRIAIVDLIEARGIEAANSVQGIFSKANITKYEELAASFQKTWEYYGRIDFVFANAGITDVGNFTAVQAQLPPPKPNLIAADVNFIGTVYTCYLAIHYLRRNSSGPGGSIITTSSGAGLYAAPPIPIYSAAKHGVVGLTRSLSYTLRPENIFVHCVLPGAVKTNIVDPESMKHFPEDQYTSVQGIVHAVDSLLFGKFAAEGKSGRIVEVSRGRMNHRDQLPYVDEVMAKVMGQLLGTVEIKSTNTGVANHSRESKI